MVSRQPSHISVISDVEMMTFAFIKGTRPNGNHHPHSHHGNSHARGGRGGSLHLGPPKTLRR